VRFAKIFFALMVSAGLAMPATPAPEHYFMDAFGVRPMVDRYGNSVTVKPCNQEAPHWTGVTAYVVAKNADTPERYEVVCGDAP
jgi:hypothetical protein